MVLKGTFAAVAFPSPEGGLCDVGINPNSIFPASMNGLRPQKEKPVSQGKTMSSAKMMKFMAQPKHSPLSGAKDTLKPHTHMHNQGTTSSLGGQNSRQVNGIQSEAPGEAQETPEERLRRASVYQLYSTSGYFGEWELLFPATRKTTMRCECAGATTVSLARRPFNFILREFPKFHNGLRVVARRREDRRLKKLGKLFEPQTYMNLAATTIQRFVRDRKKLQIEVSDKHMARHSARSVHKDEAPSSEFPGAEGKRRAQYAAGPHVSAMPSLSKFSGDIETPRSISPRKDFVGEKQMPSQVTAQISALEEQLAKVQHEQQRQRDETRRGQEQILREIQELAQTVHALSLEDRRS
jgi:hypothetical protein